MTRELTFAVVDFETTGLYPKAHDRVIEVAVIRVDLRGEILGGFTSLVNPNRDLGPTHLHGIAAGDVSDAPSFKAIAGDVLELLEGAIFVGHNAIFDLRFLEAEMARLEVALPSLPRLCTMRLARRADTRIPGRSLNVLCEHFGVPLRNAHSAYDDAVATACLLWKCAEATCSGDSAALQDLGVIVSPPAAQNRVRWPTLRPSRSPYTRARANQVRGERPCFIAELVRRLPTSVSEDSDLDDYLALLDRVLEYRRVEEHEFEALLDLADELGLSQPRVADAHRQYLRSLVSVALEDQVITESERRDLDEVRRLLGISPAVLEAVTEEVRGAPSRAGDDSTPEDRCEELTGKSVCFTGTLNSRNDGRRASRALAQKVAGGRGMEVRSSVTRDLDILVVADPDSMSSKAKKARDYGVRIVAEPVFWRMAGIDVE